MRFRARRRKSPSCALSQSLRFIVTAGGDKVSHSHIGLSKDWPNYETTPQHEAAQTNSQLTDLKVPMPTKVDRLERARQGVYGSWVRVHHGHR
ncbi:hypothetical protein M378DRAFT_169630 [Amanita muscaria Koide BX008]|uniref:Uncharacterized protein n=1 Tax=Amanita muscaria (strain Koide BX008) TaxID=946122 RepID=A0A0C2S8U2_AMAMK|nr:hypothetical protein M378DRAFT_169630 [Amanita muscaria Koide BX008]